METKHVPPTDEAPAPALPPLPPPVSAEEAASVPVTIRPVGVSGDDIFVSTDAAEVMGRFYTLLPHMRKRCSQVLSVPMDRPAGWTDLPSAP